MVRRQILVPLDSLSTISSTFNLFFKVLFTFPSLYFFAIGLLLVFSFGWDLSPVWAAFPNNPTLRNVDERRRSAVVADGTLTLHVVPFPEDLYHDEAPSTTDRKTTIRKILGPPDFKFERCPLRSPLLRTSWLVSFPPVINMLKFTGWTRLIWGRESRP